MSNKLLVAPAPHITKDISTNGMMFGMIMALLPTAISGIIAFGINALWMILVSVGTGYVFDYLFRYLRFGKASVVDLSGAVTGFVMALILPVSAPLYFPVIGNFIALVVFKGLFGGIGKNIFNPAAVARMILGIVFSGLTLTMFNNFALDGNVSSPLYYFITDDYSSITLRSLFFGTAPGAIGTASIFCILLGGISLMLFSITDFIIPVGSIITFIITTWIGQGSIAIIPYLFSGSFMFATMFMITDPTSSPNTVWGKLCYGLVFGLIAGLFRVTFVFGETGVFFAVVIANLVAPLLDKIFAPRPLGIRRDR